MGTRALPRLWRAGADEYVCDCNWRGFAVTLFGSWESRVELAVRAVPEEELNWKSLLF